MIRLPAPEGADRTLGGSKDERWGQLRQRASLSSSHRLWPPSSQLQASSWNKHTPSESSPCHDNTHDCMSSSWFPRSFQCDLTGIPILPGDTLRGWWKLEPGAFYTVNYVTEMYFLIFTVYICNRVWPWFCQTLLKCFFQTLFAFFSIVALSSIFSYNTTNDRAEDTHRWKQCTALPREGTTS